MEGGEREIPEGREAPAEETGEPGGGGMEGGGNGEVGGGRAEEATRGPGDEGSGPAPELSPTVQEVAGRIEEEVSEMERSGSGLEGMRYFYGLARGLFTKRVEELRALKEQGKKLIGVFCNFVPEELVIAAGAVPIRLCSGCQEPIATAEEVLPRNFCPAIKSSLGMLMVQSPHFQLADLLITPTTCDGKKKMAEVLAEYRPTWVLEVPHTTLTTQARQLWANELAMLKRNLEQFTGNRITRAGLRAAIELTNRRRALIRRLYEARKREDVPIWGRDALLATNLWFHDDPARWAAQMERLCDEVERRERGVADRKAPRILLTGSPVILPTWKLPRLIEESGGVLVADEICTGAKVVWDPVYVKDYSMTGMLLGLADRYLMNSCACFTPNRSRVERLLQFAQQFRASGVVYHVLMGCYIYSIEARHIERALMEKGTPMLTIETDYSTEDVEQIRTRVEAFLEMITSARV
ncbi:MAG: double-cubane-cluster-containing anaerobic reductase [Thermoplasmata archaeon]